MLLSHIKKLSQDVAQKRGLRNPVIEIKPGSKKGDGFLGDIFMITATDAEGNKLETIVKSATQEAAVIDRFPIAEAYENEEEFYRNIYPKLKAFQAEKNIPCPFGAVARYYDAYFDKSVRLLALENLRVGGYEMFEKKATLDAEHIETVFTEYGRLHGACFAYQSEHSGEFNDVTSKLHDGWILFSKAKSFTEMLNTICKDVSRVLNKRGDTKLIERFKKCEDAEAMFKAACVYKGEYKTLTHGDCWSNNLMFKYETANGGKRKLKSIRILDWQICRVSSPVFDLSYFLYASASKPILDDLNHLLDVYYASLQRTVRDLGYEPDVLYPFQVLKSDWKTCSMFGFLMALLLHRIKLTYDDSVVDLSDLKDVADDGEAASKFCNTQYDEKEFNERVVNLIKHLCEIGVM